MNLAKRVLGTMDTGCFSGNQANLACHASQAGAETILLDQQAVSADKIDELEELQCNWIGVLCLDQEIDASSCHVTLTEKVTAQPKGLTLYQLISSIQESCYEAIAIEHQTYWVHTLCLRVIGLGRVRLILCFDHSQLLGDCVVLATNRLDWSPRRILSHWLHHSQISNRAFSNEYEHRFPTRSGSLVLSNRALTSAL